MTRTGSVKEGSGVNIMTRKFYFLYLRYYVSYVGYGFLVYFSGDDRSDY